MPHTQRVAFRNGLHHLEAESFSPERDARLDRFDEKNGRERFELFVVVVASGASGTAIFRERVQGPWFIFQ